MGIMDNIGDAVNKNRDKIGDAAKQHGDKIDAGIDRTGDFVDEKTGNKYAQHVDKGQDFARDQVDRLGGADEAAAQQARQQNQ